jgi:esterase/lipase superfamily enzyme
MPLMPTPEALKDPRFDVFAANPAPKTSNEFRTFYVTTRTPAGEGSTSFFTAERDDTMHFGHATARVGPPDFDLERLVDESTTAEREDDLSWTVLDAPVLAGLPMAELRSRSASETGDELSPPMQAFFEQFNRAIDSSLTNRITVYAHGANNNFTDSIPRGTQFQYFTGGNEIVLTFAWPSPGRITGYSKDRARSNAAAEDFADLLVLLARHSTAERINVIGFSAGGRVAGGGLGILGRRADASSGFRIGHVYLTASDEPMKKFLEDLPAIYSVVSGLTVTANPDDPVLRLARITDTRLRVGEAGSGTVVEAFDLNEEQAARLEEMVNSERMNIVDLSRTEIEDFKFSHGAWYENPWVSTDVLVSILDGLPPAERGLKSYSSDLNYEIWYFPENYVENLTSQLLARRGSDSH